MRLPRAAAILVLLLGPGCVVGGPHCLDQPAVAVIRFDWPDGDEALMAQMQALGWAVETGRLTRHFDAVRSEGGVIFRISAQMAVPEATSVMMSLEGDLRGASDAAAARAHLEPAAEPLAARFDGQATYQGGATYCS